MEGNSHIVIDRSRRRLSSIIIRGQSEMLPNLCSVQSNASLLVTITATSESTSELEYLESISSALA